MGIKHWGSFGYLNVSLKIPRVKKKKDKALKTGNLNLGTLSSYLCESYSFKMLMIVVKDDN